ncbi:MAG: DNA repair exonuclease [Clostridia bacterium]|nr:DNA repair exonuclease [Clostridia bacterium]
MIKILHCADIHLDSPFSLSDVKKANTRRALQRGTFTSIMLYARTEKVDIMLLPGDIFDTEYVTRDTASLLVKEFEQASGCRFVIAPGNHDPFSENSPYAKLKFPPNVYIFNSPSLTKFSFDDINTDVYGFAFTCDSMAVNPFAGQKPADSSRINILCCHGDITPGSHTCPISVSDIENSGFDYVALGHIHNSTGVQKAGDTFYAYSGCPEGRGFDECGKKSVILAIFAKDDGQFRGEFAAKQMSKRRYEKITADVSGAQTMHDVTEKVNEAVREGRFDADTTLRVTLTGDVSPSLIISTKALEESASGLYYIEVIDKTRPCPEISDLEGDPTIRGAFYGELKEKLQSSDENERRAAERALRLGLAALSRM